jgi:hypothetical protein
MCVLTYIPISENEVVLTHNRDEDKFREAAITPSMDEIVANGFVFPKDPKSGGTWFAASKEKVYCLLNGSDKKHEKKSEYPKSRGTVILDFINSNDSSDFDPRGLEPFTLVEFDFIRKELKSYVWDEHELIIKNFDHSIHQIWSSSTLYSDYVKGSRSSKLDAFLSVNINASDILDFHSNPNDGKFENSLFVKYNERIETVAITQMNFRNGEEFLRYKSFLGEKEDILINFDRSFNVI